MPISLNEIKSRAIQFSNDWKDETRERAEKDTFWNEFFNIFGINRRRVASFEEAVKKFGGNQGYIDCFWPGTLLIEHKSLGKSLEKAKSQAFEYFPGITEQNLPRYILTSDFQNFQLFDIDEETECKFTLSELPQNVELFSFIAGYQKRIYREEDPVNIQASELMGDLHDELKATGYTGEDLEIFLVRILFIMFADDTGVWERDIFSYFIENRTNVDGSDLGNWIAQIFQILNTPSDKRQTNLDEDLVKFSYINGGLFSQPITIVSFNSRLRELLLKCCKFDWSKISPAVFGSLFQYVMDRDKRRNFGAHYTEEKNILKTIQPLFLDELYQELGTTKSIAKLHQFHDKLASLKFFDPACGCGNFLVITYREIRKIEHQVLAKIYQNQVSVLDIETISKINVNQFYGIEIGDFAAKIAETAMWLMDHIMNIELSKQMGEYFVRIPLQKAAKIITGNALTTDWGDVLDDKLKSTFASVNNLQGLEMFMDDSDTQNSWQNKQIYIIGNPPFVGSKLLSPQQRLEMKGIFSGVNGAGVMDYVTAWYIKAGQLMKINSKIQTAFVSTNSISQGEQVGILWGEMFGRFAVEIKFAHQSFSWTSEAKGKAQVTVIIIGFRKTSTQPPSKEEQNSFVETRFILQQNQNESVTSATANPKTLYTYPDLKGEPISKSVKNINPYLIEGEDVVIQRRQKALCNVPEMNFGNMPLDGGFLILTDEEKNELVKSDKVINEYIKPLLSAREFLNNGKRWCLWLVGINPSVLRNMPNVLSRVENVKKFRENSVASSTRKFAKTPTLFRDLHNPEKFVLIPGVSSENREYIPMGIFGKESIVSNSCFAIPDATLYHFGILTSKMHMAWVKYTCGRLESRFRYSKDIVYNNFPWPGVDGECEGVGLMIMGLKNDKLKLKIEECAREVLEVRKSFMSVAEVSNLNGKQELSSTSLELAKSSDFQNKKQELSSTTSNSQNSSLADLYDLVAMPPELVKVHQKLDKVVDEAYKKGGFSHDNERVEWLFEMYKNMIAKIL